ncbi:MAG: type II toxin-antitoxin system VapC family toxin [Acidobacteriia bacterium]|nr:type II toxin-antitoxin system VapC family toxin [Terriglobia bacterium]
MRRHVLDANALYRLLTDDVGAEIVELVLEEARQKKYPVLMSVINWGEVYYTMARTVGYKKAESIMRAAENPPIVLVEVDKLQAEAAGRIRAGYGLPYADCFAAVLAGKDGVLVTSDVKDFKKVPWVKTLALPAH